MIVHIWFALDKADEPLFLRKNSLEFYWDDNEFPSVRVPFGDFFGIGHGKFTCVVILPPYSICR